MTRKPLPGERAALEFGGRKLFLRYNFRAIRDLKDNHGIDLFKDVETYSQNFGQAALVIHAGIVPEQPDVTLDWVLDTFEFTMLRETMNTIAYAISGNWPEHEDQVAAEIRPNGLASEATPTGLTSGPSGAMTLDNQKPSSGI